MLRIARQPVMEVKLATLEILEDQVEAAAVLRERTRVRSVARRQAPTRMCVVRMLAPRQIQVWGEGRQRGNTGTTNLEGRV